MKVKTAHFRERLEFPGGHVRKTISMESGRDAAMFDMEFDARGGYMRIRQQLTPEVVRSFIVGPAMWSHFELQPMETAKPKPPKPDVAQ